MMWQTELSWTVVFSFLGAAWFVVPWYAIGVLGALFVVHDMRPRDGAAPPTRSAWAWAVLVCFFSFVGLALYYSRRRGAGQTRPASMAASHQRDVPRTVWGRVLETNVHVFAATGLGIMVGRIVAHTFGMSFWQAFWLELLSGLGIGWRLRLDSPTTAPTDAPTASAGNRRTTTTGLLGVLLSVLPMLGGVGAVTTYLTPMVATAQPRPWTFAFWGFGMLGLMVGFALAYPMSWMSLKAGWHGFGRLDGAATFVDRRRGKRVWLAAMALLAAFAIVLPAWLTMVRQAIAIRGLPATESGAAAESPAEALFHGVRASLLRAVTGLRLVNRTQAALAMDDAMRAAEVGTHVERATFQNALGQIQVARLALQQGREAQARAHLEAAYQVLQRLPGQPASSVNPRTYRSATVINPAGSVIGDVRQVSGDVVELAVGGRRNVFGFLDLGARSVVRLPMRAVAFGPRKRIGTTFVAALALPQHEEAPRKQGE